MYGTYPDFSRGVFSSQEPRAAFQMLQRTPHVSSSWSFTAPDILHSSWQTSRDWALLGLWWNGFTSRDRALLGQQLWWWHILALSPLAGRSARLPCHGHPVQQDPAGCVRGCSCQCWLAFASPNLTTLALHSRAFGLSIWNETDPNTAEWPYTDLLFSSLPDFFMPAFFSHLDIQPEWSWDRGWDWPPFSFSLPMCSQTKSAAFSKYCGLLSSLREKLTAWLACKQKGAYIIKGEGRISNKGVLWHKLQAVMIAEASMV